MASAQKLAEGRWYSLRERKPPDGEQVLFVLERTDGAEVLTGTLHSVPQIGKSIAVRWMRIPQGTAA